MRYSIPVLCLIVMSAASSAFGLSYRAQIIGPTSGTCTETHAISDSGVVAGDFMDYSIDPDRYEHAFMWSLATGTVDLGRGSAVAIDSSGNVVGTANRQATRWTSQQTSLLLGVPGASGSAGATNDDGIVAGSFTGTYWHACYWDSHGTFHPLEDIGNYCSAARAVNTSGVIAGYAAREGYMQTSYSEACIWNLDSRIQKLGTLGGGYSEAYSINDAGQVIGFSETADHGISSFIWDEEHGMRDLGFKGAWDINDSGQIIGWGYGEPFVWDGTTTTYLPAPEGYSAERAYAINNAGWIVGTCRAYNGSVRAVLWEPVPEPASMSVIVAGIAMLSLLRKRR